jgi:hypothetical protein
MTVQKKYADNSSGAVIDWLPLVEPYADRWQWLVERAKAISDDYPYELAAITRVEQYVFAEGLGRKPRVDDVLFVLGLVISLFDRDIDFELPGELFADRFPHWVGPTHRLCA